MMAVDREQVMRVLAGVAHPGGGDLVSRDLIRALGVDGGVVRFVIEAATPDSRDMQLGSGMEAGMADGFDLLEQLAGGVAA